MGLDQICHSILGISVNGQRSLLRGWFVGWNHLLECGDQLSICLRVENANSAFLTVFTNLILDFTRRHRLSRPIVPCRLHSSIYIFACWLEIRLGTLWVWGPVILVLVLVRIATQAVRFYIDGLRKPRCDTSSALSCLFRMLHRLETVRRRLVI